jgi:hypothetical protein
MLSPALAAAQTSYPMITHAYPVAVERGKATEVTVEGQQDFTGAYQVIVEGTGVAAEVVTADPPKPGPGGRAAVRSVKVKFNPAPDARLGVREFRVVTTQGASSVGQIVIVDLPVTLETPNNNSPDKATPLAVPAVACGKIEAAEDVDCFKFHAEAGQVLTFEVQCARLQDKIHDLQKHADPLLTILDAGGKELTASDEAYFADPMLTYRFERAGDYTLQVRDAKYDGDPRWVYAVIATDRPYVSHVFPLALRPGQATELELVGPAKLVQPQASLTLPGDTPPGITEVQLPLGDKLTNPVGVVVTSLPTVREQEPNDSPDHATRVPVPCCINGRIGARRDLDYYVFSAKKGQSLRFEVKARRFGTPLMSGLDASLDILNERGAALATGDDISPAVKDAAVTFTPPADGDYYLRVRDLLNKGGEQFVYAVEVEPAAPDFALRCDDDKAMLGPGGCAAWYVHVTRLNAFAGPVEVQVKGLPAGVSAHPLTIPANMNQGLLLLSAAADAPRGAANVEVVGTAKVKAADGSEQTLTRRATPNEEIYLPGGGRGRFDVRLHTVAVTEKPDIEAVEVSAASVTLKPGEEVKLDVRIKRRAGFEGNVTLDVRLRHLGSVYGDPLPPGVTMVEGKSKTLLGKGSEGTIVLKAAANAAPVENVPVSVVAHVSINFVVKVGYSSRAIPLSVVPAK